MNMVSLFDGIGGFPLAFARAGVRVVATVEIDKPAAAIGARHFPHARQFDDVTKVSGDDLRAVGFVSDRGIVTAGWPCQDFSVAGRRAGLDGSRSGLWWEVVRILADLRPRWFLGENVPGLLSSVCDPECEGGCMETHGGAMGAILGSLAELGYGVAYRVLDAQHFGVPQRRQRVFIVGHLGEPWSAPAQVLLEPESGDGDSASGEPAGAVVAADAARGADTASEPVTHTHTQPFRRCRAAAAADTGSTPKPQQAGTSCCRKVVAALTADGVGTCGADDNQAQAGHLIIGALTRPGRLDDQEVGGGQLVVSVTGDRSHTLTSEGADESEDGTGRGTPIIAHTLTAGTSASPGVNPPGRRHEDDYNLVVQPLAIRGREGGAELEIGPEGGPYNALRAGDGGSSRNQLLSITSLAVAGDFSSSEDVAQTVRSANGQPGVVAIHENQRGELTTSDTAGTLKAGGGKPGQGYPAIAIDMRNAARASGNGAGTQGDGITEDGPSYTLSGTQMALPAVAVDTVVRRLTELECERLQGYPDGWTDGQSGSARYRQLGNSVAVPVVEWMARRLIAVDEEINP